MHLKKEFITHVIGDEQIMVAVGGSDFSGLVRSNATAAFIVDCLRSETDLEGIVAAMLEKYDVDRETARRDAEAVLDKLCSINAIEK